MRRLFVSLSALLSCLAGAQVVCIDPGHVSDQSAGTRGRHVTEVRVAWRIANQLRERLVRDGYAVVMTKRSESERVSNRRRAEIANSARASLMVRLHCDASNGTGFAVYYPTRTGRAPDGGVGPSASVLGASGRVAPPFHRAFARALAGKLRDNGLLSDQKTAIGGRQGALTGSIYSQVPVVLVEMVVLTNPKDEAFVSSASGRRSMVDALAAGIRAAVPRRG